MNQNKKSLFVAAAVAAMFAAAPALAKDATATTKASKDVKCSGVNSCKGTGSCSGADNSCKGQNSCKGKGWSSMKSEKACTTKGGTVVTDAK